MTTHLTYTTIAPLEGFVLADLLCTIKSYSAQRLNTLLGMIEIKSGVFFQTRFRTDGFSVCP